MCSYGLFGEDFRLQKLSELGDSLEKLNRVVDWEIFRETLNECFKKENKGCGGRPAYDYILMFKIVILQKMYNLSDDRTEFQINDRMSFMRFLGLNLNDRVPDSKTIWLFKEKLAQAKIEKKLFNIFNTKLKEAGLIQNEGVIVDATFVEVPKQRNTREENKDIKDGKTPEGWGKDDPKTLHKVAQKDIDARWTSKNGERYYGYKNHVKADVKSKVILDYTVTSASVHDSNEISKLVKEEDRIVYADSAYKGKEKDISEDVEKVFCEKGYRGKPLTELQKLGNKIKSRIRARIEHIFGFMTNSMNAFKIRCIGKKRADFNVGLANMVYNMCRLSILRG